MTLAEMKMDTISRVWELDIKDETDQTVLSRILGILEGSAIKKRKED